MMTLRRKFLLVPALTLLAGLASAAPTQAGIVVNVSEGLFIFNQSGNDTISSLTFSYAGLNGISAPTFIGGGSSIGSTTPESPIVTDNAVNQTVTLTFTTPVHLVGGSLSFNTTATTANVQVLAATIQPQGLTIVAGPASAYSVNTGDLHFTVVAAVPEPTSSAMFGIGIVLAVGLGWGRRRRELNKLAV
jgi:hypothetical protein